MVLATLGPGCRSKSAGEIELAVGPTDADHASFTPRSAFAEYLELPDQHDELRITLAGYEASCDRFVPPDPGLASLTVTIATPPGSAPDARSYAWAGHEAHGGSPSRPLRAYAVPAARIGRHSYVFPPGGSITLTHVDSHAPRPRRRRTGVHVPGRRRPPGDERRRALLGARLPTRRGHAAVSLERVLGLEPGDARPAWRLGSVLGVNGLAETLIEGVVTSAFLARVGAASLPAALAARAVAEVLASLAYGRRAARTPPRRALVAIAVTAALGFAACAPVLDSRAGLYVAYVLASVIARLTVIHFGVLALSELESGAPRSLPVVYAGARLGGVTAGPILAIGSGHVAPGWLLAGGALAYGCSAALQLAWPRRARPAPGKAPPLQDGPPSLPARGPVREVRSLLPAIVVGAAALAFGRVALRTQSGAVLEAAFTEAELARVLGLYFSAAGLIAVALQLGVVGRLLDRGALPVLNLGWSLLYAAAQTLLALGPASVGVALGARLVEGELRNAVRTPVANLLYDAMPPARRSWARTLAIGVTVPLASLCAGVALAATGAPPAWVGALGMAAAVVLAAASWAQNRGWAAGTGRVERHLSTRPRQG